jgi:hypothetical protein
MNEDEPAVPRGTGAIPSMPAFGGDRSYPAVGFTLRPGPTRTIALIFVGIPLLLIIVFGVLVPDVAAASSADNSSSGQAPNSGFGFGGYGTTAVSLPQPTTSRTPYRLPVQPPMTSDSQQAQYPLGGTSTTDTVPSTSSSGPDGVVQQYFAAINQRDFATAWSLGGQNLDSSYSDFTAGFASTAQDTPTILSVAGDTVSINLVAVNTDGTQHTFTGSLTVVGGVITSAHLLATG